MTINDFNDKIHLPSFCGKHPEYSKQKYKYIKIPRFGWFAYNSKEIKAIYDFQKNDESSYYRYLTKTTQEYQAFSLSYSELSEERFHQALDKYKLHQKLWKASIAEIEQKEIYFDHRQWKIQNLLNEIGLHQLLKAKIGLITESLINQPDFKKLDWPKGSVNKLLIPSFCTPEHICSLELAAIKNIPGRTLFWQNGEMGWYGDLSSKLIVEDIDAIGTKGGFVWDSKADQWTSPQTDWDFALTLPTIIQIFSSAERTDFKRPLIELIKTQEPKELRNYLDKLTFDQASYLEKELNITLLSHWHAMREKELHIGNIKVIRQPSQWIAVKKGRRCEVSNFVLEIDKLVKMADGTFVRIGHIFYKDTVLPYQFSERVFQSPRTLERALKDFFITSGLGLPYISQEFKSVIMDIIAKFNQNLEIIQQSPTPS